MTPNIEPATDLALKCCDELLDLIDWHESHVKFKMQAAPIIIRHFTSYAKNLEDDNKRLREPMA